MRSKSLEQCDHRVPRSVGRSVPERRSAPSFKKGLIAGLIVVIGAGLAAWYIGRGARPARPQAKKPATRQIAEVTPQVVTNGTDQDAAAAREEMPERKPTEEEILLQGKDTNEWVVVTNPYTHEKYVSKLMTPGLRDRPPPYFQNDALNIIDAIQYAEMGDPMIGVQIDERFMAQFQDAIVRGVDKDEEGDDDDRLERKAAMRETLEDLRQQIKEGGDAREIINDALKERRRVSALRDTMKEERARMRDEGASEEEIVDFERACNKKLEELGAKPMITKELIRKKGLERQGQLFETEK